MGDVYNIRGLESKALNWDGIILECFIEFWDALKDGILQ